MRSWRTWMLVAIFLGAIFLFSLNQLKEFDAWFHLKTGEYIVKNFTIPTQDIFSYTAAGRPWVMHSWLAEVIFYLIYLVGGLGGLIIFVALVSAATYYLVVRLALKLGANLYVTLLVLFFPAYMTQELWVPRPQIFSYLFLVLLVFLLESFLANRSRRLAVAIPILFLLWGNIHASVILGLAVLIWYAFFDRRLWPSIAAAVAVSFLNPNTYKIFTYSLVIREVVKTLRVEEWYSILYYIDRWGVRVFMAMMFLTATLIFGRFLATQPNKIHYRLAGLFFGIAVLPFISIRHVGFFPLVVVPMAALALSELAWVKNLLEKISDKAKVIVLAATGALLMAAGALYVPKEAVNDQFLPVKALDFVKAQGIKGPLFNLYNEGGYLIWRLWPEEKVFIDGRSEVYAGEPLQDILKIVNLRGDWKRLIDEKYKINYFLLPYRPPLTGLAGNMMRVLTRHGFKVVYWDDAHVILLRDAPQNKAIIEKYAVDLEKLSKAL